MISFGVVVCDSSPLITLAKAGELDVLLSQPWPIQIPDAVYREAAHEAHADGMAIADWVAANEARVRLQPTQAGLEQDAALRAGLRARNAGENAAVEVVDRFLANQPDTHALLLYEDDDVTKLRVSDRTYILTTGGYLGALEEAGLIQSADYILDRAAAMGRNVTQQREAARDPADIEVGARLAEALDPSRSTSVDDRPSLIFDVESRRSALLTPVQPPVGHDRDGAEAKPEGPSIDGPSRPGRRL